MALYNCFFVDISYIHVIYLNIKLVFFIFIILQVKMPTTCGSHDLDIYFEGQMLNRKSYLHMASVFSKATHSQPCPLLAWRCKF